MNWLTHFIKSILGKADRYQEGLLGYYKCWHIKRKLVGRTPTNLQVEFFVTFNVIRVDDYMFKAMRMLDEGKIDALVDEYCTTRLQPYLDAYGAFYLRLSAFDWDSGVVMQTNVHRIRFTDKSGAPYLTGDVYLINDASSIDTMHEFNQVPFERYGCIVTALALLNTGALLDNKQMIEENFRMIPIDILEKAKGDIRYRAYDEFVTAAGMQRKIELEQSQTHATSYVAVKAKLQGSAVVIEWHFTSQEKNIQGFLLGFRKEGGFALDKWSESENGTLVVDSPRSGHIVEHVERGKTYYYTFFLKAGDQKVESIRFQMRIPMPDEVAATKGSPPAVDPHEERRRQLIQGMSRFRELLDLFIQAERKGVEEIKAERLAPEDEQEKIAMWKEHIQSLRAQHL